MVEVVRVMVVGEPGDGGRWCSGNNRGVTLLFLGREASSKTISKGVVGAGVNSLEPRDKLDGRRLPLQLLIFSSCSMLALVRTMLGCLVHWGARLRHIVGSESERAEKKFESCHDLLRLRGREGDLLALLLFCGTLRRLL